MAATGRDAESTPAEEIAARLAGADLVRITSAASGDALAATGTLARALVATGTGFQASVVGPFAEPGRATDADCTVAVGRTDPAADLSLAGPGSASARAFAVASELGEVPDPALALAGTVAASDVDEQVAEAAEHAGLERRPGVGVPTEGGVEGLADCLAHSTLFHAPFSGDVEAARDALVELDLPADAGQTDLDDDDRRRVASLVALAAGTDDAADRAAAAVERALRPYHGGPVGTVAGFADVLDAAVRVRPGVALTLALGDDSVRAEAIAAWRQHATAVHEGVAACETARYDGLVVARGDAMPVATVARLLADFRAPEPVVLAVADGVATVHAATAVPDGPTVAETLAVAAEAADGESVGDGNRARARFDGDGDADDLVAAFREAR